MQIYDVRSLGARQPSRPAIRNGGCGIVFYFSNLGIIQRDHWTDLDGVRVGGVAVTARQIRKNGPGRR